MHFRQIANPQMRMARLKSGDLQPLCKMPSRSRAKLPARLSFPRGTPSTRGQTARRRPAHVQLAAGLHVQPAAGAVSISFRSPRSARRRSPRSGRRRRSFHQFPVSTFSSPPVSTFSPPPTPAVFGRRHLHHREQENFVKPTWDRGY